MSKSTRKAGNGDDDDLKQKDFEPTGYELMEQSKSLKFSLQFDVTSVAQNLSSSLQRLT